MGPIVVKFGGSSLATAGQFEKVADIIHKNPDRRYVVASAPGKRCPEDTKVTDLLYRCYDAACAGKDFRPALAQIQQRFDYIIAQLQLQIDLSADLETIAAHLSTAPQRDYMASRGEYLNSKLLAAYLGVPFVDAAQIVLFRADGMLDVESTNKAIGNTLQNVDRAVIPGFYGTMPDGTICTFSRGGSDVTGAIVARAVGAALYENWTDVSGVLAADPRIVENPRTILPIASCGSFPIWVRPFYTRTRFFLSVKRTSPSIFATPTAPRIPAPSSSRHSLQLRTSARLPVLQAARASAASTWKNP